MDTRDAQAFALQIAPLSAAVANFCDHVEHNETADRAWVLDAATGLRCLTGELCDREGLALVDLYAERLGAIEARNVLAAPGAFDGHGAAIEARSWRELQLVQAEHDRHYHQDVVGLAKNEQLRHYALHLAKVVGAFATPDDPEDLLHRRLPDVILFAMKLSTVMGVRLSDDPLPGRTATQHAVAASSSSGS
ncbi:MAG TPA: hypothetical protein VHX66_04005 [Solirubrobacteraceae bacterium]|jgi:hypothetical protein|nr:hypothetical protein [Solirubrobacteraceae bacterium]